MNKPDSVLDALLVTPEQISSMCCAYFISVPSEKDFLKSELFANIIRGCQLPENITRGLANCFNKFYCCNMTHPCSNVTSAILCLGMFCTKRLQVYCMCLPVQLQSFFFFTNFVIQYGHILLGVGNRHMMWTETF